MRLFIYFQCIAMHLSQQSEFNAHFLGHVASQLDAILIRKAWADRKVCQCSKNWRVCVYH